MKFVISRTKSEKEPFMWKIVSSNGQTLAISETYVAKASCMSAIESVMKSASGATVVDET